VEERAQDGSVLSSHARSLAISASFKRLYKNGIERGRISTSRDGFGKVEFGG
jgi:hypothetical protein